MKIILSEDVANVGKMGAEVTVADGFARNYLLPRKLAVQADSATAKQLEHEMRLVGRRMEKQRAKLAQLAKSIEGITVEIKVCAGEEDKIFGSVTSAHIAEQLAELGHTIDRKNIMIEEPIKSLGIFVVPIHLASGIQANLKVWVSPIVEEVTE